MRERVVVDLAHLSLHGEKSTSVTWWGTWSFILIEGTGFAVVIGMYLYLASLATHWPIDAPPPDLGPGTGVLLVLLVSGIPNYLVMRWARLEDLRRLRVGLIVMVLFGIAPLIHRSNVHRPARPSAAQSDRSSATVSGALTAEAPQYCTA